MRTRRSMLRRPQTGLPVAIVHAGGDAATGNTVWTVPTGGIIFSSPTVANGVVYVGASDGRVYAFDAATGSRLRAVQAGEDVQSSPSISNGRVYVGTYDNAGSVVSFGLPG